MAVLLAALAATPALANPFAAAVRPTEPLTPEEELKSFVLARLAPYKHPRRVITVESLPRTHLGKVDRGRLRGLAGS